jgi:hypothetical protein
VLCGRCQPFCFAFSFTDFAHSMPPGRFVDHFNIRGYRPPTNVLPDAIGRFAALVGAGTAGWLMRETAGDGTSSYAKFAERVTLWVNDAVEGVAGLRSYQNDTNRGVRGNSGRFYFVKTASSGYRSFYVKNFNTFYTVLKFLTY